MSARIFLAEEPKLLDVVVDAAVACLLAIFDVLERF